MTGKTGDSAEVIWEGESRVKGNTKELKGACTHFFISYICSIVDVKSQNRFYKEQNMPEHARTCPKWEKTGNFHIIY